jgi:hypothetical protein
LINEKETSKLNESGLLMFFGTIQNADDDKMILIANKCWSEKDIPQNQIQNEKGIIDKAEDFLIESGKSIFNAIKFFAGLLFG